MIAATISDVLEEALSVAVGGVAMATGVIAVGASRIQVAVLIAASSAPASPSRPSPSR